MLSRNAWFERENTVYGWKNAQKNSGMGMQTCKG